MKRCLVAGAAAALTAAGLLAAAPPAGAGCQYGGAFISKCDGPVQPDGTWQRCVAVARWVPSGLSSHLIPEKHCATMGSGLFVADPVVADPPVRIAD